MIIRSFYRWRLKALLSDSPEDLKTSVKYAESKVIYPQILFKSATYYRQLNKIDAEDYRAEAWFYTLIEFSELKLQRHFVNEIFEVLKEIIKKDIRNLLYEDLLFILREQFNLCRTQEYCRDVLRALQKVSKFERETIERVIVLMYLYATHIRTFGQTETERASLQRLIHKFIKAFVESEMVEGEFFNRIQALGKHLDTFQRQPFNRANSRSSYMRMMRLAPYVFR